jgi:MFS family permease
MANMRDGPQATLERAPRRGPLIRWFASYATLTLPQAAGPVAFSLIALSVTGKASGGAAMILAMTLAQIVGAIPATRLGRNMHAATFLRLLVAFRTLALAAVALSAYHQAPFSVLILLAALAGSVNGAAYGYLRALLSHFTTAARLPRALGIAATLNEVTFVLAPVLASALGSVSPVVAVLCIAVLGGIPALLIPQVGAARAEDLPQAKSALLTAPIVLWLSCAAAEGAAVAAIEIGAVALALKFGFDPALAILFTVPLCIASVAGGVWVSLRNRMAGRKAVLAQLAVMTFGATLAALGPSLAVTILGAVLIGAVIAPLSTYYSLVLEALAPPQKRPEVFALLRTANAIGVIFASALLTVFSLAGAMVVVAIIMFAMTATIAVAPAAWRKDRQPLPVSKPA